MNLSDILKIEPKSDAEIDKWELQQCDMRFENCGIGSSYKKYTLQNFRIENDIQKSMLNSARNYFVNVLSGKNTNMILLGNPGAGKTHIAVGLLREFSRKKIKSPYSDDVYYSIAYHVSRELCSRNKATMSFNSDETYEHFIKDISNPDVIVIDEVGKGADKNEYQIIFDILDKRMQENKTTILISNFTYDELASNLGDYGISRLNINGNLIRVDTIGLEDYRQKVK